jgi:hypothetical protein
MQIRYAKKLHNRDEVEVKLDKDWVSGYIVGDPVSSKDGKTYWFDVQTVNGFVSGVHHKELK